MKINVEASQRCGMEHTGIGQEGQNTDPGPGTHRHGRSARRDGPLGGEHKGHRGLQGRGWHCLVCLGSFHLQQEVWEDV